MQPTEHKIRPLPLKRSLRAGQEVYLVGPMFVSRGRMERGRERGKLYFRAHDWKFGSMLMPFDPISGSCTYSTHRVWQIAQLSDARVAAQFKREQLGRDADEARAAIAAMSDTEILALVA